MMFPGCRRLVQQHNHTRQFRKTFPGARYRDINPSLAEECAEFCRDWFGSREFPLVGSEGERQVPNGSHRVYRGGGFSSTAARSRSAYRDNLHPELEMQTIGLRPSRRIE